MVQITGWRSWKNRSKWLHCWILSAVSCVRERPGGNPRLMSLGSASGSLAIPGLHRGFRSTPFIPKGAKIASRYDIGNNALPDDYGLAWSPSGIQAETCVYALRFLNVDEFAGTHSLTTFAVAVRDCYSYRRATIGFVRAAR